MTETRPEQRDVVERLDLLHARERLAELWAAANPDRRVLAGRRLDGLTERIRPASVLDFECRGCGAGVGALCRGAVEGAVHVSRLDRLADARNRHHRTCPVCQVPREQDWDEVPRWPAEIARHCHVRVYSCCARWVLTTPAGEWAWEVTLIDLPRDPA